MSVARDKGYHANNRKKVILMSSSENATDTTKKSYQAPELTDYGKMSELTTALPGNIGCDGSYPSYTDTVS